MQTLVNKSELPAADAFLTAVSNIPEKDKIYIKGYIDGLNANKPSAEPNTESFKPKLSRPEPAA